MYMCMCMCMCAYVSVHGRFVFKIFTLVCRYAEGQPASVWIDNLTAPRTPPTHMHRHMHRLRHTDTDTRTNRDMHRHMHTHTHTHTLRRYAEGQPASAWIDNLTAPRTPDYNASCPDFHWTVAHQVQPYNPNPIHTHTHR